MYGSVARNRIKPGKRDEYLQMMEREGQNRPPGAGALLILKADSDPDELWMAVAFESQEAYRANADSPEMNERYQRMQEYMVGPPEWHDGEVLLPWATG